MRSSPLGLEIGQAIYGRYVCTECDDKVAQFIGACGNYDVQNWFCADRLNERPRMRVQHYLQGGPKVGEDGESCLVNLGQIDITFHTSSYIYEFSFVYHEDS